MTAEPIFPPLLHGEACSDGQDPFAKAIAAASIGTDAGLVCWSSDTATMRAAVVFAPEEPANAAATALLAVTLGIGDAIGALAPPEVAVHYVWPLSLKVNGADCGQLRAAISTQAADATPDWLVIGLEVPFQFATTDPGRTPEQTCLYEEGCGEVTTINLIESWSRHMLTWLNRREQDGLAPLHAEWRSRAWNMGEALPESSRYGPGVFMGLDERAGMLVKSGEETRLIPLLEVME
ncbi:MAG: DUF4444 domain-containing protein [Pseudomonadota bacterium]